MFYREREVGMLEGFNKVTDTYRENYNKYGYSEKSLIMPSDRRNIRYYELIKNFDFFIENDFESCFSMLDAGCGFGDVNSYLKMLGARNYKYYGIDVVDEFLEEGKNRYKDYDADISYMKRNLMLDDIGDLTYDYAISSQAFTFAYNGGNEIYEYMFECVKKMFVRCRKAISFNFYTDKGEYFKEGMAYHNPAKVLNFAYTLSKNVILDNGCFPYECTVTIIKEQSAQNGMIYDRYMKLHKKEFENGIFVVKTK